MNIETGITLFSGVYITLGGLLLSCKDIESKLVFKVIPFTLGVSLVVIALMRLGFVFVI